jgi:translation initiation factor IF-2
MNQALIPEIEENNIKEELPNVTAIVPDVVVNEKEARDQLNHIKPKSLNIVEEKSEEVAIVPAKTKVVEQKKLKKSDIFQMLDSDSNELPLKTRSLASIKRARAKEKRKHDGDKKQDKIYREVIIPEVITVGDLANKMSERAADVIRELMKMGVIANSTQSIDADTAELIATTLGHSVKRIQDSDIENILITKEDSPEDLKTRAPIVTVMGHVDHGKTSLLDALKETDVVAGEAGGITQHIGAYSVTMSNNKMITFIDTPGHEAFTEMRTRGAQVTDIVVLVVAADDSIKPQTIEAINHAKAAKVPIIVAINKIDKADADIEKVKSDLLQHELVAEDFGGDIMIIPVSAKAKINLDKLEEAILLVAEMQDLKANPNDDASGVVIESRMDKGVGAIATVIIQRGTLKKGDLIIAGRTYGKIKRMNNDKGRSVAEAGPSFAVEIHGLDEAPSAGDIFNTVTTEKQARDITQYRQRLEKDKKVTASKTSLEDLFNRAAGDSKIKDLPIIIKGDVHGSIEAIISSLNKIESSEIKLKILHKAVGGITESDVSLATASGALIIGFNVRSNSAAIEQANKEKIDVRYYSIIYNLIDDIKTIMSGMLSPIIREEYIGSVIIRDVFNITKVGKVAGSYVTKGIIKRGAGMRLIRDDIVIHEGKLKTLKRFKDDVKEVREGFECGIAFEHYEDIKVGDLVEVFEIVKEQQQL